MKAWVMGKVVDFTSLLTERAGLVTRRMLKTGSSRDWRLRVVILLGLRASTQQHPAHFLCFTKRCSTKQMVEKKKKRLEIKQCHRAANEGDEGNKHTTGTLNQTHRYEPIFFDSRYLLTYKSLSQDENIILL